MTLILTANETASTDYRETYDSSAITRNYVITQALSLPGDPDDIASTIDLHDARAVSTIPLLGDAHPDLDWPCVSVRAAYAEDGSQHVVDVEVEYRQTLAASGGGETFTNIQVQPQLQFVDAWKTNVSIPFGGDITGANENVSGGTCISTSASPSSVAVVSGVLTISHEQVGLPWFSWLMGQAGRRNSVYFLGFNPGSLAYAGPSVRQISTVVHSIGDPERAYEVTHTFHIDSQLHCRQYVKRNSAVGVPPTEREDGCVSNLKWKQPFPYKSNFWTFGIPGIDGI